MRSHDWVLAALVYCLYAASKVASQSQSCAQPYPEFHLRVSADDPDFANKFVGFSYVQFYYSAYPPIEYYATVNNDLETAAKFTLLADCTLANATQDYIANTYHNNENSLVYFYTQQELDMYGGDRIQMAFNQDGIASARAPNNTNMPTLLQSSTGPPEAGGLRLGTDYYEYSASGSYVHYYDDRPIELIQQFI